MTTVYMYMLMCVHMSHLIEVAWDAYNSIDKNYYMVFVAYYNNAAVTTVLYNALPHNCIKEILAMSILFYFFLTALENIHVHSERVDTVL